MSLDLDSRQRAMLHEMGVRIWLPESVVPSAAPAPTSSAQTMAAVAIENAAASALSTGAAAQKPVEIRRPVKPTVAAVTVASPPAVLADGIAEMDWPALADAVTHCQACPLCEGRRAPVLADAGLKGAPRLADWLVVGDPPEEAEERAGAPFAEQVGQLLGNMLKAVGVQRLGQADEGDLVSAAESAYLTNVVKCRPASARNPTPQELATCEHFLRREVALVQPQVILAMGRFAAQTLLHGSLPEGSKLPFGKLRGQVYRYQGIPVIVTYHPSYLLRSPLDKARAWADLCLALQTVQSASLRLGK
jgi:DNA polymerase